MKIFFATNNSDMGGGEVMLLNLARAARSLGHQVTIIAQTQPDELIEAARDEGFTTLALPATNRKAYMAQLRAWRRRNPQGLLWCNGLVPSLATAGMKKRIVHLHQMPVGKQIYAYQLAKRGSLEVLVPSHFTASQLPGSRVLENWVGEVASQAPALEEKILRVGFLGRPSLIKGTHTLAAALQELKAEGGTRYQLLLGGEAKFVDEASQDKVQQALATLGQDLTLLGWVEPAALFSQIDLLVVPSEVPETFGLVAAEAMSAKVPLVISDAGALPEVVGEGYPWVYPQGDVQQLAQAIRSLEEDLRGLGLETGMALENNYWRWYENYSPQAGKERVKALLDSLEGRGD